MGDEELTGCLSDIEDECKARVEQLVKQIANVTEELKANNQMLCVHNMNNIKNRTKEIAYNEIIIV